MTTNAVAHINIELNRLEKKDENIRITRSLGSTVEFLDVQVTNDHGTLKTSVFHKPAAEPYILPYLSDHPRHVHRSTVKLGLLRAARLCSHVEEFDRERLNHELILLLNGYPPQFIAYHYKKFFQQNQLISPLEPLNNDFYQEFHRKLLLQPTRREKQQQQSQEKRDSNTKDIYISLTFESGPLLKFKDELKTLWKKHYRQNIHLNICLNVNKNLQQLLVKKKPPKSMLISGNN